MMRRVRVLHIITRMNVGGAAGFVVDVCRLLPAEGFECHVVSGPEPEEEGSIAAECETHGARLHRAPSLGRAARPLSDLRAASEVCAHVRAIKPDVIHTHTAKAGAIGRWAARRTGVPAVHHVHGWAFLGERGRLARLVYLVAERVAARWCRYLLAVAEADVQTGLRLRIGRPEQYLVVPAGIDVAAVRAAARERDPELMALRARGPLVGFVGRLCAQKAPLIFVEAAARVRQALRGRCVFVVVGDGPLRAHVDARIQALGLADAVVRHPFRSDVPRVLAALDVLAHPSAYEGLPRLLLEAQAVGVPVVATPVGGCGEIVRHEETGLIVPAGSPEATADAVLRLLEDRPLAAALAAAALARVDAYDIAESAGRLAELYRRLASGPNIVGP